MTTRALSAVAPAPRLAAPPAEIGVACIDDDDLVTQIVRITLKQRGGFAWAGDSRHPSGIRRACGRRRPDVILLDVCIPGVCPLEAVRTIRASCPSARVLLFTACEDRRLLDHAIASGAWGWVLKRDTADSLADAITRAAGGEMVLGDAAGPCRS